jgi:hypothetical protein
MELGQDVFFHAAEGSLDANRHVFDSGRHVFSASEAEVIHDCATTANGWQIMTYHALTK